MCVQQDNLYFRQKSRYESFKEIQQITKYIFGFDLTYTSRRPLKCKKLDAANELYHLGCARNLLLLITGYYWSDINICLTIIRDIEAMASVSYADRPNGFWVVIWEPTCSAGPEQSCNGLTFRSKSNFLVFKYLDHLANFRSGLLITWKKKDLSRW